MKKEKIISVDRSTITKGNKRTTTSTYTTRTGKKRVGITETTTFENQKSIFTMLSSFGIIALTFLFFIVAPYLSGEVIDDFNSQDYHYTVENGYPLDINNNMIIPNYVDLGSAGVNGVVNGLEFLSQVSQTFDTAGTFLKTLIGIRPEFTYSQDYYIIGNWNYSIEIGQGGIEYEIYTYVIDNDISIIYSVIENTYTLKSRSWFIFFTYEKLNNTSMITYLYETGNFS